MSLSYGNVLFHMEIHKNPAASLMAVGWTLGTNFFSDGFEFGNYGMYLRGSWNGGKVF